MRVSPTLDYIDIRPDILPETSTVGVEICPRSRGYMLKFRRIIAQAGILWLKLLCVMAERHTGGPGSLHARRLRAVLQSPLAETHRALAAPEGPFDLWGEGVWRQYPIGEPRQTLTSVWLPDGHGAAGLQDLKIPQEFVRKAVFRQTPQARVSIMP
jgi:hypothetical protein